MHTFKRIVTGLAGLGILAAGISLFSQPAPAVYCRPTMIPVGYHPIGGVCALGCDSQWYSNGSNRSCVVYGPRLISQ